VTTVLLPDQLYSPPSNLQTKTEALLEETARIIAQCRASHLETQEILTQTRQMRADAQTMCREAIEMRERSIEQQRRLSKMRDARAKARAEWDEGRLLS
jgi:hypothetical protein